MSNETDRILFGSRGTEGFDTETRGNRVNAPRAKLESVAIRESDATSGCAIANARSDFGDGVLLGIGRFLGLYDIALLSLKCIFSRDGGLQLGR